MSRPRRVIATLLSAPLLVMLLATAAFAYWKSTGSGTGSATAANSWTEIVGNAPSITLTVSNGAGHRNVFSGTTTVKSGTLTVKVYSGTSTAGTLLQTYTGAITQTGSSPYSWTVTSGNNDLSGQVTAQATQVNGGDTSNQPTSTFTAA